CIRIVSDAAKLVWLPMVQPHIVQMFAWTRSVARAFAANRKNLAIPLPVALTRRESIRCRRLQEARRIRSRSRTSAKLLSSLGLSPDVFALVHHQWHQTTPPRRSIG